MNTIAYCHPFVPPEWIATHRLRPQWLRLQIHADGATASAHRGVCPVAGALVDAVDQTVPSTAIVLTTTCDQIRYVAALLQHQSALPVFLMHVPRTWQTTAARSLYREELLRLGRFLQDCGGKSPTTKILHEVMVRYDQARAELLRKRDRLSASQFAQAVVHLRGDPAETPPPGEAKHNGGRIRLGLVGGPMLAGDDQLLQILERAGGQVVLDATEAGEATLPRPFDPDQLQSDPFEELVRAYFDISVAVFRRPNDRLYQWLRRQIVAREIHGLIVRRYLWCDLWHAEIPRLREQSAIPLLQWDAAGDDPGVRQRAVNHLEAFLEMLQ